MELGGRLRSSFPQPPLQAAALSAGATRTDGRTDVLSGLWEKVSGSSRSPILAASCPAATGWAGRFGRWRERPWAVFALAGAQA